MKRILLTAVALFAFSAGAFAQHDEIRIPKRHYINLAHANQKIEFDASERFPAETFRSDYGAAAEFGSTYFFNGKRPVMNNTMRFGLDWSYADLQYASFRFGRGHAEREGHFANIGMQIGPSVTVTPVHPLHIRAYVHYAPSVAGFSPSDFEDMKFGYAGYVTGGVQCSYRFVTLGVEIRSGRGKLWSVDEDALEEILDDDGSHLDADDLVGPKTHAKLSGLRLVLGFRF